jgi:uncharacterized protein HemX
VTGVQEESIYLLWDLPFMRVGFVSHIRDMCPDQTVLHPAPMQVKGQATMTQTVTSVTLMAAVKAATMCVKTAQVQATCLVRKQQAIHTMPAQLKAAHYNRQAAATRDQCPQGQTDHLGASRQHLTHFMVSCPSTR